MPENTRFAFSVRVIIISDFDRDVISFKYADFELLWIIIFYLHVGFVYMDFRMRKTYKTDVRVILFTSVRGAYHFFAFVKN